MQLPSKFIHSLELIESFDMKAFELAHQSGEQVTSIRINQVKINSVLQSSPELESAVAGGYLSGRVPWTKSGFYLSERPSFTFDPLFHAGCYYVQEASSMFIEQALNQTVDLRNDIKILDLSAAPGGKSTHILSLITSNSLLVSNEVIRSRANILKDNITKWGTSNAIITNNDPADFGKLQNYFDVIVVDAPCSGSGLFRKDPDAISEWSENNVVLCSQRQQRILADIIPALKDNGILIYSTCSYSVEEDEQIHDWLMQSFPLVYRPINIDEDWHITDTGKGYRFWPDKVKGEGFFIACFQKTGGEETDLPRNRKILETVSKKEIEILSRWTETSGLLFFKKENTVYGWPDKLADEFNTVLNHLRVIYSGTLIGELVRDKLVPAHALALSNNLGKEVERLEISRESAITYLQRKTPDLQIEKKGWQVVTYKNFSLGWINALQGRFNNYYPKELRIIKEN
jgi:16S rRNA C967 or C1407 C5-methylase (RsmB/RsmF family)/NOL1/NOP2/fmu family ribosome biogenesis protein